MIISLNTGIYNNIGTLVYNPKLIIMNYIKKQFIADIINILQINMKIDSIFYIVFCFIFRSIII